MEPSKKVHHTLAMSFSWTLLSPLLFAVVGSGEETLAAQLELALKIFRGSSKPDPSKPSASQGMLSTEKNDSFYMRKFILYCENEK